MGCWVCSVRLCLQGTWALPPALEGGKRGVVTHPPLPCQHRFLDQRQDEEPPLPGSPHQAAPKYSARPCAPHHVSPALPPTLGHCRGSVIPQPPGRIRPTFCVCQ